MKSTGLCVNWIFRDFFVMICHSFFSNFEPILGRHYVKSGNFSQDDIAYVLAAQGTAKLHEVKVSKYAYVC